MPIWFVLCPVLGLCEILSLRASPRGLLKVMPLREEEVKCMVVCFEDNLDLYERLESPIHLVGHLIADQEPS